MAWISLRSSFDCLLQASKGFSYPTGLNCSDSFIQGASPPLRNLHWQLQVFVSQLIEPIFAVTPTNVKGGFKLSFVEKQLPRPIKG
ncbi:MAG: hypothetical protein ACI84R_002723 [Candidatus Azotimanducaceae bacterium]|jgi:hypothetical protein